MFLATTEPQVFPHEAEARQGEEAKPPHSSMDPPPNGQHHPVRLSSTSLAKQPVRQAQRNALERLHTHGEMGGMANISVLQLQR